MKNHKQDLFLIVCLILALALSFFIRKNKNEVSTPVINSNSAEIIKTPSTVDSLPTITAVTPLDSTRIITAENSHLKSSTYYRYAPGSFELVQEKGWDLFSEDNTAVLQNTNGLKFAFKKKGTQCVLGYFITDKNFYELYAQHSFADRVMSPAGQLDSSWHVEKQHLPQGFTFNYYVKLPLDYEARLIPFSTLGNLQPNTHGYFILYNQENGPVSADCNDEASAMLATLRVRFEPKEVDLSTKGLLFFNTDMGNTQLFLATDDAVSPYVVKKLNGTDVTLYKNTLYFRGDGGLNILNPFTGLDSSLVSVSNTSPEAVNEYYVYKDKIYYFIGDRNCNEYRAHCVQRLYILDLVTRTTTFISDKIPAREIAGYDPDKKVLYMYWSDGDAGCSWISSMIYDFNLSTTTSQRDYGACAGEPGAEEKNDAFKKFLNLSAGQSTTTQYLLLDSGNLSPAGSSIKLPGWNDTIRYVYP